MQQSGMVYKVRARGSNWREYDKVRLEISVGQPYHEGEKFAATMAWARANFSDIALIIGDLPQRYNLVIEGMSENEAWDFSLKSGDKWLERNGPLLCGCTITRWNDWLNHHDFSVEQAKVINLFENHQRFQDSIIDALDQKFKRSNLPDSSYNMFRKHSIDYLLEETTVFAIAYRELKGISAYPGSFLDIWSMFLNKEIPKAPEGLEYANYTRLQFEKRFRNLPCQTIAQNNEYNRAIAGS
jgi:tRNA-dependent cyclodipeptide synthase